MKIVMTCILYVMLHASVHACEMCGCSAGGNSFGLLPGYQKSFIGLRFQSTSFSSKAHDGSNEQHQKSNEYYQSLQLWGRAVLHPKWHAFVFVPYKWNQRKEGDEKTSIHGIGDLSILVNYIVLNVGNQDTSSTKQLLQCGGGIKLPTGKFNAIDHGIMLNENMQIGTGSVDIPCMAMYTLRHKNSGLNVEANYSINTANDYHYQFGNKLSTSLRFLKWIEKSKCIFLPQLGMGFEHSQIDKRQQEVVENSGGHVGLANAGMDVYYQKISLAFQVQQPIVQHSGNGLIQNKTRMNVNLIYLF